MRGKPGWGLHQGVPAELCMTGGETEAPLKATEKQISPPVVSPLPLPLPSEQGVTTPLLHLPEHPGSVLPAWPRSKSAVFPPGQTEAQGRAQMGLSARSGWGWDKPGGWLVDSPLIALITLGTSLSPLGEDVFPAWPFLARVLRCCLPGWEALAASQVHILAH